MAQQESDMRVTAFSHSPRSVDSVMNVQMRNSRPTVDGHDSTNPNRISRGSRISFTHNWKLVDLWNHLTGDRDSPSQPATEMTALGAKASNVPGLPPYDNRRLHGAPDGQPSGLENNGHVTKSGSPIVRCGTTQADGPDSSWDPRPPQHTSNDPPAPGSPLQSGHVPREPPPRCLPPRPLADPYMQPYQGSNGYLQTGPADGHAPKPAHRTPDPGWTGRTGESGFSSQEGSQDPLYTCTSEAYIDIFESEPQRPKEGQSRCAKPWVKVAIGVTLFLLIAAAGVIVYLLRDGFATASPSSGPPKSASGTGLNDSKSTTPPQTQLPSTARMTAVTTQTSPVTDSGSPLTAASTMTTATTTTMTTITTPPPTTTSVQSTTPEPLCYDFCSSASAPNACPKDGRMTPQAPTSLCGKGGVSEVRGSHQNNVYRYSVSGLNDKMQNRAQEGGCCTVLVLEKFYCFCTGPFCNNHNMTGATFLGFPGSPATACL